MPPIHTFRISAQLDELPKKEVVIEFWKKRYRVVSKDNWSDCIKQRKFLSARAADRFMRRLNRNKKVYWSQLKLYKDDILMEDWSYRQKKIIMPVRLYLEATNKEYPLHFICEKEECNCQYISEVGSIRFCQSGYLYKSKCPKCGRENELTTTPWINNRPKLYCDILEKRGGNGANESISV